MAFEFFKKKKKEEPKLPHYDPTNIGVLDIRKGFVFDYQDQTWEAAEEYEYDWGDNAFTYEYKIVSAGEVKYLYIEEDDDIRCIVSDKIPFGALGHHILNEIQAKGQPPRQIIFEGITYFLNGESPGYFRNINDTDWSEFISWAYYDNSRRRVLNIEQWGDHDFDASLGVVEPERAFSNILPV